MGLCTNQPEEPDGIGVLFITQMDLVKLQGRFCKTHIVTHAVPAKFIKSAGEELTKSISMDWIKGKFTGTPHI